MIRTAYGAKRRSAISFEGDPGLTKQAHKDECDVNLIIKRHKVSGVLTHVTNMERTYGNMVGLDYHDALLKVRAAEAGFAMLPSDLRNRFENDPGMFLDFVDNPDNAQELVELGLATRQEVSDLITQPPAPPVEPPAEPPPEEPPPAAA